jgi:hypothetical protein
MWHLGCILRRQIVMANRLLLFMSYADFAVLAIPANPCKKRARHLWLAYRIWLMFLDFVMAKEYRIPLLCIAKNLLGSQFLRPWNIHKEPYSFAR